MQKKKTIILFDIDYTLFDTDAYREILNKKLSKITGFSKVNEFNNLFNEVLDESKKKLGHVSPKRLLQSILVKSKNKILLKDLEKVFWDKKNYSLPIYQDVKDLLLFLKSNKNLIIGIFSKGNKRHQKQKINSLKEIFEEENIHIFLEKKDKLAFILKKYENNQLYFVDDSLMILREVKITDKNACTIWIKRKKRYEPIDSLPDFSPDKTIKNLKELRKIIN